jgi:hypothetical protein
MMIKAINSRTDHDLGALARLASEAGKENIFLAGDFMRRRVPKRGSGEKA